MAQNIVLSWLAGCRVMELKTVQVLDQLEIPRPCIDMETIGFNVEWSQELRLAESLDEYVKAWMLIHILKASGAVPMHESLGEMVFDMSVGYDLAGIQTPEVQAFIDGMLDAGPIIERLRKQIPDEFAEYRDLDFPTRLSSTLTLSTFHGCPPDEIERMLEFLLDKKGLHCIVKLNPTLLGEQRVRELLHDTMGYKELSVPSTAFEKDTTWEQATAFVDRLGRRAEALGLGFGVKFSNTLIVYNHRHVFPKNEREMYLSGPPLHVLAMNLVGQFRARFGDRFPISFSAGIDAKNFADAVALGLAPITVCSDFLTPGGYGRAAAYFKRLSGAMGKVGARDIDEFIVRAYGHGARVLDGIQLPTDVDARCRAALDAGTSIAEAAGSHWPALRSAAILANTETYVASVTADQRYFKVKNSKPPRKLETTLELFDCVSCDKCVPVCPNDANFSLPLSAREIAIVKMTEHEDGWRAEEHGTLKLERPRQWANFADFCNECGNCDAFCPEHGGPYILKPRFFGSAADWREFSHLDGFYIERLADGDRVLARIDRRELTVELRAQTARYAGPGFDVSFDRAAPETSMQKTLPSTPPMDAAASVTISEEDAEDARAVEIDLSYFRIVEWIHEAVVSQGSLTYPGAAL